MTKATPILNGFKNITTLKEIVKGVISVDQIDNSQFDIFSKKQVSNFVGEKIDQNIGFSKEIQKGIVNQVKSEVSHLLPIQLQEGNNVGTFFVSKKGVCLELLKAVNPVNEKGNYFKDPDINEQDILDFIQENNPSDEELVKEFGNEVIDILNSLSEAGKIDVDDDGNYIIAEEDNQEDENDNKEDDNKEDDNQEGDKGDIQEEDDKDDKKNPLDINNKKDNSEEVKTDEDKNPGGLKGENINLDNDDDKKEEEVEDIKAEDDNKEDNSNGVGIDEQEVLTFIQENNPSDEDLAEKFGDGIIDVINTLSDTDQIEIDDNNNYIVKGNIGDTNQEGIEENQDNNIDNSNPYGGKAGDVVDENQENENVEEVQNEKSYSPEELENFASKTATATLIKFYQSSADEDMKNVAKIELEKRGIDLSKYPTQQGNGINGVADTQEELQELKGWIDEYFLDMDNEDLIKYVTDLALDNNSKRKELKNHYRKAYQIENGGNSLMKVNEDEFETWLKDKYFNNFAFEDLKDYALKLLAQDPKEIQKMQGMHSASKNMPAL